MRVFLLTWNPRRWSWDDLASDARRVANGHRLLGNWSTGTKQIRKGDRLFLLRQGKEPRGIIASAWATSDPYEEHHWDPGRKGRRALYVDLEFDWLVDPDSNPEGIIPRSALDAPTLRRVNWNTQMSGIEVKGEAAARLCRLWRAHVHESADRV